MAGGNWTQADVGAAGTRPGVYINFQAVAAAAISPGVRGIVALAAISNWGPEEVVQSLTSEGDISLYYGNDDLPEAKLYRQAREIFRAGANKILAFRMVGANGVLATLTLNDSIAANVIRLDGKYQGTYGNGLSVTISDNATDSAKKDLILFLDGVQVRSWTATIDTGMAGAVNDLVAQINADTDNVWVDATLLNAGGNETLADVTDSSLVSGSDGDPLLAADYTAAMDALELQDFNVFVTDTISAAFQASIATWVQGLRDTEGNKVIAVLGSAAADTAATAIIDAAALDHEGLVYVFPGATLPNVAGVAVEYAGAEIAVRVAGMIAATQLGKSITFGIITGATDVETRLTNADVKLLLAGGVMPIVWNGRSVVIEKSINSLTTLGTKPASFNKVTVVQTIDTIANAIKEAAEDSFIGKIPNDAEGRQALINSVSDFMQTMVRSRAIQSGFTVVLDPDNVSSGDQVFLLVGMTPVDAVETIFTTIEIGS